MVCLIFHTAIIVNRKNWRITIKLHFENLGISFLKSERTHMLGPSPPPPVCFCSLFNDLPPSPPQRTYFLNDPLEIWLKAQCIDQSRYQFFEHCKILPSLLFYQWLIKKNNQMLNQMKVKKPETNCVHHRLNFNVCLITCNTIENGKLSVMVRCTLLGNETFWNTCPFSLEDLFSQ